MCVIFGEWGLVQDFVQGGGILSVHAPGRHLCIPNVMTEECLIRQTFGQQLAELLCSIELHVCIFAVQAAKHVFCNAALTNSRQTSQLDKPTR